jgi:hypothetical protein
VPNSTAATGVSGVISSGDSNDVAKKTIRGERQVGSERSAPCRCRRANFDTDWTLWFVEA